MSEAPRIAPGSPLLFEHLRDRWTREPSENFLVVSDGVRRFEEHDRDLAFCPRLILCMEVKGADHEIPRECALRLGPLRARRKRENPRRPKQHYFRLAVFFLASKALSGLRDRTVAPAFHISEFLISDSSLSNLAL